MMVLQHDCCMHAACSQAETLGMLIICQLMSHTCRTM